MVRKLNLTLVVMRLMVMITTGPISMIDQREIMIMTASFVLSQHTGNN